VPQERNRLTPEGVLRHCRAAPPDFLAPRYVDVVDTLPKSATQKIERRASRRVP